MDVWGGDAVLEYAKVCVAVGLPVGLIWAGLSDLCRRDPQRRRLGRIRAGAGIVLALLEALLLAGRIASQR